jgi:RNA 3'-terminal phosphate cyclase (ATP)
LEIDGSLMEGGGQLLRMATSYSAVLGEPIKVYDIRAKRSDPGLKPQHLTTLKAVAEITSAELVGASLGSSEISFKPENIRGGNYSFDIGTAGSVSLLLQCIMPIMLFADKPSRIHIQGGTAVRWSPTIPFLEEVVYKALKSMGASLNVGVERQGFYPKGGGLVNQVTNPVISLNPLKLGDPDIKKIRGVSICGALPEHVALRQARSAEKRLNELRYKSMIKPIVAEPKPQSPGSLVFLWAEGENIFMGADSLGARGKPAEVVGDEAAVKMIREIRSGAHVDEHTADHLILPASLAGGESVFRTSLITLHSLTAIEVAKLFTDAEFTVTGREGEPGAIKVKGIGLLNRS